MICDSNCKVGEVFGCKKKTHPPMHGSQKFPLCSISRNILQSMFFQNVAAKLKAFQLEAAYSEKIISSSKMRPSLHCQEETPKLWCPAGPQEKAFCVISLGRFGGGTVDGSEFG